MTMHRPNLRRVFLLALFAMAAVAVRAQQLDERCTVSILNRTAQVQPDGTWAISNVPANIGLQRARATCSENGVTYVGVSELLFIPRGAAVGVGGINFIFLPVPAKLSVTAPVSLLANTGDMLQLTTKATYPDGSVVDISSAPGTTYSTTNPAIATVSSSGIVQAVGGGNVIVSAMNDGGVGMLRLAVGASLADSDGDGMPDVWELANGFDPHDPADAAGDADGDGLTNLQEYQLGTNPHLRDTDGDGVSDGLEVQIGTDPLDPNSYNLARALRRVDVTPNPAHLHLNDFFPDSSLQLTVKGTMLDGATIDLTTAARGTQYATDNPFIANFGPIEGMLYPGGSYGTCTITVTSNGFVIPVSMTVDHFTPGPVSTLDIPGYANNVKVAGSYALIAAGSAGLQVVDVHDPAHPAIVASLALPGTAIDIHLRNDLAYIADGLAGLVIVDIHNPLAPSIAGSVGMAGTAQDLWLDGNYAWIASGTNGLTVVNITNPAAPSVAAVAPIGNVTAISVSGALGVAVNQSGVLIVLDTTNPLSPVQIGSVPNLNASDVVLRDRYAWVSSRSGPGMLIVDLLDPANPSIAYMSNGSFIASDLALFGQFAVMDDFQFFVPVIPFTDGTDPTQPFLRQLMVLNTIEKWAGTGIDADARFIYSTREKNGLSGVFGDTGTTRLFIAQWRDDTDTAGIAPTVSITSPLSGAHTVIGSRITATVNAADDHGVGLVTLLMNGREVGAAAVPPYTMQIVIPPGATTVTLTAIATDFGGNSTRSADIVISTDPDPLTTISGLVKTAAGAPVNGAVVVAKLPTATPGVSATTDATGHYSIIGLPTIRGPFSIKATGTIAGAPFESNTLLVQPVTGGIAPGDLVVINDNPVVAITAPANGSNVVEGAQIEIDVQASAFNPIDYVQLSVNGLPYYTAGSPFTFFYSIPSGAGATFTFTATAFSGVYSGDSPPVSVHVIADPGTTLRGTVRKTDGTTLAGATVSAGGNATTTDSGGTYSIAGLPTINTITVTAHVPGGLHPLFGTIDVTPVPGGITTANITVNQLPNGTVSRLGLAGYGNAVAMHGTVAVVAEGNNGLELIDITNVERPVQVGTLALAGTAIDVRINGTTAIVAGGSAGVHFVDVSDPAHPSLQSTIPIAGGALSVAQYGSTLLVGSAADVLHLFDVSNPATPVEISSLSFQFPARSIAAGSGLAIVIEEGQAGIYTELPSFFDVIDIGDPQHPVVMARQSIPGLPRRIEFSGTVAYAAMRSHGLQIIDVGNPALPSVRDANNGLSITGMDFTLRGPTIAVAGYAGGNSKLGVVGEIPSDTPIPAFTGAGIDDFEYGQAVALYDTYALFVEASSQSIGYATSGSSQLAIVKYSAHVDTAGHPPSVSITSPAANSSIVYGDSITVHVNATDDVGVASVTLTVNGRPLETRTSAPFDFTMTVPPSGTTLTLGASATDFGEATAQAPNVVVNLIADPLTTVTGIVRDAHGTPVAGASVDCRGVRGVSNASGNFTLPGVTTVHGDITATAAARTAGVGQAAFSIPTLPVRGGTTNVGSILMPPLLTGALSSVTIPGYANGVAAGTDLAAVAAGAAGLQLVDLNDPYALRIIGSLAIDDAVAVTLAGNFAYVLSSDHLTIVDITDPAHPVLSSSLTVGQSCHGIAVGGGRAYIVDPANGMFIVDVSTPTAPTLLNTVGGAGGIAVALSGSYAIVLLGDNCCTNTLDVVSITNPLTANIVSSLALNGFGQSLAVDGSFAYVASNYGGTAIVDISQPAAPVWVSSYSDQFSHTHIATNLGFIVIGHESDNPPNLLRVVDVTTPLTPVLVRPVDFGSLASYATTGIAVASELVITTAVKDRVSGFGSTGTSQLFIGKYRSAPAALGVASTKRPQATRQAAR